MDRNLELKNQLLELNTIIKYRKIIYIDEPIYFNIWDIAINYATLAFFKDNNFNVVQSYSVYTINYDCIQKILDWDKDISIVIIGWWWFSDLYLDSIFPSQVMREKLISRFKNNQILLLPSSIYFKDPKRLEITKKIFSENTNLEIIARDHSSFDYIKQHFSNKTYLLPDMVQWLYNTDFLKPIDWYWELKFYWKDIESLVKIEDDLFDWENMFTYKDYLFMYWIRILFLCFSFFCFTSSWVRSLWSIFILKKYNESIANLNVYDSIDTDRLHGMIISLLLWKKVVARDNITKKISSYYQTWYKWSKLNINFK